MNQPNDRIANNPRLLFWGRVLVEAKTLSAIIVLFYLHRGLGLNEVFYLSIVWSLTALMFEIPSGYLADRIGRKHTLQLGAWLLVVAQVLNLFAYGFWPFVLVFVCLSASHACFSGTEEALLYESLAQCGKQHQMNAQNGKQISSRALPAIFLPAIGAWFATDLLESQFQILILVNVATTFVAMIIFSRLTEPVRLQSVATKEIGIFKQSLTTIRHEPWLLKVTLNKLLVFIAVFIAWRTTQPILVEQGFHSGMLGIFYILTQVLEFVGGWFAGAIEKKIGTAKVISLTALVMLLLFLLIAWTSQSWIIFFAFVVGLSMHGFREPLFSHAVNQRLHSRSRATTLSNLNMIKGVLDIPLLLLAGWLSTTSLTYPLLLAVLLCVVTLVFFPIKSKELTPSPQAVAS